MNSSQDTHVWSKNNLLIFCWWLSFDWWSFWYYICQYMFMRTHCPFTLMYQLGHCTACYYYLVFNSFHNILFSVWLYYLVNLIVHLGQIKANLELIYHSKSIIGFYLLNIVLTVTKAVTVHSPQACQGLCDLRRAESVMTECGKDLSSNAIARLWVYNGHPASALNTERLEKAQT